MIGFLLAVLWDRHKEKRKRTENRRKSLRLLQQEATANCHILGANRELLNRDNQAANDNKEIVIPLSLLHTQSWESIRLTSDLDSLDPDLLKQLELSHMKTLILNQQIQGRELYRLTNQSMSNFNRRRRLINENLQVAIKDLLPRFQKHGQDLAQLE